MTWELNQGVEDIVSRDINEIVNLILPDFIMKPFRRLYRSIWIYFYADTMIDDPGIDKLTALPADLTEMNREKFVHILEYNKEIEAKTQIISDWFIKTFIKLNHLYNLKPEKKSHHLANQLIPMVYDSVIYDLNHMIRGPDRAKLKYAFSFHRRN